MNMQNKELDTHRILHHLDDPLRILKWTIDEAAVLILPFFIGIVINQLFVSAVFAILGIMGLKKLKSKFGQGTLKHLMYWYFPHNKKKLFKTPPSYIREYIG